MKLIYEEGEKERIEKSYEDFDHYMFKEGDVCGINFKVTNPAIASYILGGLLNDRIKDFDIGIDVTQINFRVFESVDKLRDKLHYMIDEILL